MAKKTEKVLLSLEEQAALPRAGLLRRLAALLYDMFLVAAIWICLGFVLQLLFGETTKLVDGELQTNPVLSSLYFLMMISSAAYFYIWFWRRTGQTLGMQVWNIRVQNDDGTPVTWLQAFMRMLLGIASWLPFGLGYLWQIVDKDSKTWTDRFSDSVTVAVPRPTSRHREKD